MAIWRIHEFQPLRDRWEDCIKRAVENKKYFDSIGVKSRCFRAEDGGPAIHMTFITEVEDWIQQGKMMHRCESDPEYSRMFAEGLADSVHENYSARTVIEVPLIY